MRRKNYGYIFLLVLLSVICFGMVYPFINLMFISISGVADVMASNGIMLYPKGLTLYAYQYLLNYPYLAVSYMNTVFITIVGTSLALLMSILGANVLARRDLPGRNILTTFIIITMFIGGGLIPSYLNIRSLGLLNTLRVLILPAAISTWNMLLLRNFMMAIPQELTEAARIDGCGEIRLLVQIILPLSLPILATLALFYGVARWNEYSGAIIYNSRQNLQTIQVIIRRMYDTSLARTEGVDLDALAALPPLETIRAATIIFTTLPILCVYPFLQKYFAQGIMVGSLKG